MKAVLFDLDNTLYPAERDLFSLIDVRINRYMEEVVEIEAENVDGLRRRYWQDYGATLQGLIRHHGINPEDYLDYVHAVDVSSRLSHDLVLQAVLEDLQLPCYIFTNGSRCHVDRVVTALGLEGLFADVFDIRIADYQPKPNPGPYQQVLSKLAISGDQCIMVEDQPKNLKTAKQFGMKTVLVGAEKEHRQQLAYVDAQLEKTSEIGPLLNAWIGLVA
ncbi:MAG: pyrimidine 5'-nucleotidase [Deltaproteobacteria bacterium]|jgi:putative hydrolase of the HAD superfamily|nr:pyrimidine 5'-nucleotidase [Deltaproteobacteria bacterium]MCW8893903.1 pyrimidine 5'-nucleotidase [Deltaproteobacteria bacterium]MCW9049497.1 pyrimidine 5'-nucleotidase [Deltaproteobacteria bacterium]